MTLPAGLGVIIAIVVLVLAVILGFIGQLDPPIAALFAALALARLT